MNVWFAPLSYGSPLPDGLIEPISAGAGGYRVCWSDRKRRRDRVIGGDVVEGIAGYRPLVRAVHGDAGNHVAGVGCDGERLARAAVDHHAAGWADRPVSPRARGNRVGRNGDERSPKSCGWRSRC